MSILTKIGGAAATLLLAVASITLHAEGDPERGAELAYSCLGCHGIEGYRNAYPSYRVPRLGGQRAAYLVDALNAYRNGNRPHPTMQAQASTLSEEDIADLAAWFAAQEAVEVTITGDEPDYPESGQTCLACHGVAGEAVQPTPPILTGQYLSYLVHSLEQYRAGIRANNVMTAFAAQLTDEQIEELASFYSSRDDGLVVPDKP